MMLIIFLFCLVLTAESQGNPERTFEGAPAAVQELRLLRGSCPLFWFSFNGRCYKYVSTLMTWGDAESHCLSQGANLVSIHSQAEENFVKLLIRNFDPAQGVNWIGLSDAQKDGAFFWSDGSKLHFKSWNAGEPNNSGGPEPCVHTNFGAGKGWNDNRCSDKYSFVCKKKNEC